MQSPSGAQAGGKARYPCAHRPAASSLHAGTRYGRDGHRRPELSVAVLPVLSQPRKRTALAAARGTNTAPSRWGGLPPWPHPRSGDCLIGIFVHLIELRSSP